MLVTAVHSAVRSCRVGMPPAIVHATCQQMVTTACPHGLPADCPCSLLQDDEDAKRGMYNWFAQSQALLTPPRLLLGTATAVAVPLALLGPAKALLVLATTVLVTICAAYYGNAVIGGVVGDFLGATIQVRSWLAAGCIMRTACAESTLVAMTC
jgi:cobalamin synthase